MTRVGHYGRVIRIAGGRDHGKADDVWVVLKCFLWGLSESGYLDPLIGVGAGWPWAGGVRDSEQESCFADKPRRDYKPVWNNWLIEAN